MYENSKNLTTFRKASVSKPSWYILNFMSGI